MHIIQSDPRGKFVPFISDSSDYVELGLEKPLLENPLKVEASLQLYAGVADQYTGSGEAVTATAPISLDLLAVLKTLHAISISPSVMTLDEDNTYTTFCAVEANDDADWTLEPVDPRLTVSPTSGTGRASVVVKTDSLFEPTMNFENVPLTVVSMVDDELYPDIEGDYIVDDTAEVHVEQYTPQHNALIPKMLSNTSGERDGVLTSGVTLTSAQSDPAGELNADLTGTVRAVFAITSEEDVLVIDAGEPIVLGKIELTGTNVNRTVAAGITKGGAAIAFSLEGTNDPEGTWTLLRDSSAVTHWYAMTTTTIIGNCYSGLQSTVTITRKPSGGRLWQLTSPQHQSTGEGYNVLAFNGTILGTIGSTLLAWRGTDNQGLTNVTSGYTGVPWTGREYWIDHDPSNVNNWVLNIVLEPTDDPETIINMAGGTVKVIAGEEINTSFRYYKLVPINRSLGRELSFALRRLDLFQRVSASLVSMPGIELTGSLQMAAEVYQSFDHSLTLNGFIGRFTTELYSSGTTLASHTGALNAQVLDTLDQFPTVEVSFDTPHRIRSWSIQSVGDKYYERTGAVFEALATVLVLQGRTLDGRWRVLDLARSADDWYTPDKIRTDRPVQQTEMVDKIRISAVAVQIAPSGNALHGGLVWFPQIQVFAGVPVIPKMVQSDQNGVQVKSNGGEESNVDVGVRVFDRAVSGNGIARIGSRAWYINNNHFLLEDVAENGNVSQFGSYQSKAWLALMFPKTRMFGYLYSIDNLYNRTDIHANVSYAASLYFEGRQIADANATLAPSAQWDFIDLISLDRCIGHNLFGVPTATLIAETGQTTLNNYAASLGLPVLDKTFIMNRTDYHVIRYDAETEKWVDDGLRLEPGTTAALSNQFNEMTTDDLLNQSGQARLNSVALARGESMQPPWSVIPDKATIVNQKDNRRMMYAFATTTWSEVPNNDAIYQVHDQTHYADLKDSSGNPLPLAQLRCTAQSIMNTERPSVGGEPVVMPEVQLFGLPAETINAGAVATVTYLKAEDSAGNLHDILGKHQRLPYQNWWSYYGGSNTAFRLYLGTLQHIKSSDKKLYLAVCNESGQMLTSILGIENSSYPYLEFSVYGDFRTSPTYFELYIYSTNDEKIILSSGYTGGAT